MEGPEFLPRSREGERDYLWGREVGQKRKRNTGRGSWNRLFLGPDLPSWPWAMPSESESGWGMECSSCFLPGQGQGLAQTLRLLQSLCYHHHPPPSVLYNTILATPHHLVPLSQRSRAAPQVLSGKKPLKPSGPPGRCTEQAPGYKCNFPPRNVLCSNHFFKLHKHNLCTMINYLAENDASC